MATAMRWAPLALVLGLLSACTVDGEALSTRRSTQAVRGATLKSYELSNGAQAILGSRTLPVRAKDWDLQLASVPALEVAPVDAKGLPAHLESFISVMRPSLAKSAPRTLAERSDTWQLTTDSMRAWADKQSGFLSLVDTKRKSEAKRSIFNASEAVSAVLERLGSIEFFGLQAGQTLDVVAVKAINGSMVDPKTFDQVMVLYPGEDSPRKSHILSYRVLFGRRQAGVPLLKSVFAASITPQGRLIELSRLWRKVTTSTKKRALASGATSESSLRKKANITSATSLQRRGCGYLEPAMRNGTKEFALGCGLLLSAAGKQPEWRFQAL